jgi:hypothetical protein
MALFQGSTTPFVSAVQQIADSCGASADTEMTTRAGISLNSAIRHFNSRFKWNWLLTEAAPIQVLGPFGVAGVTASASAASAAAPAGHGVKPDDFISGTYWQKGTRVSATAVSGFGLNAFVSGIATTGVADTTATRDMYDLPTDWKAPYSVRLLSSNTPLRYTQRRGVDRATDSEQTGGSLYGYDLFMAGSKGKIRLLTPPGAADILQIRYHRNMATAAASSTGTTLDIPDNYEPYLMAWAKWHFLTDKGEERKTQAMTWLSLAEDGLKTMLKDQTNIPDEDLSFIPGHTQAGRADINSLASVKWDY